MTISRRAVTSALAFPLLASCQRDLATSENASAFPSKDITYIIPASAGGGFDVLSRFISEAMRRALPHRVNIVPLNVASGGGGKGVNQLFRARPDGYTIGILNIPGIFVLQHIRAVPYNFSDFAWIGTVTKGRRGYVIAVREQSDIRTYDDLLALSVSAQ
ncbi:MAG: tripartite tricarboxylate transporter substrate-binding protein [Alphaproteobacteria bacterium]